MEANIADMIIGLEDITNSFGDEFKNMQECTVGEKLIGFFSKTKAQSGIMDIRFGIFCRLQMSLQNTALEPSAVTDVEIGNWVHKNLSRLKKSKVFRQRHELHRVVLNGSQPDTASFDAEMMLMSVRANPDHDDCLLVNRFLSEFVPYDFLTWFIFNKQAFCRDYETFSDTHREYAVRLTTAVCFSDKQELWSALFEEWRLSDA